MLRTPEPVYQKNECRDGARNRHAQRASQTRETEHGRRSDSKSVTFQSEVQTIIAIAGENRADREGRLPVPIPMADEGHAHDEGHAENPGHTIEVSREAFRLYCGDPQRRQGLRIGHGQPGAPRANQASTAWRCRFLSSSLQPMSLTLSIAYFAN